ncbi:MAG: hypothetical protein IH846_14140, partial [Acidobacteria bacterium]|nr:hypothetical protein [Acidobacteriota bacterium]
MNAAGKDFVENTLLGSVVRDADLLQSLPKSLTGKLERAIPSLIELGQRNDAWNILPEVREAIQQVTSAQARGMSVKDQLAQGGLFGGVASPRVEAIALALAKKPTEVSAIFRRFAAESRSDVAGQGRMFGKPDPAEAFSRIFETTQPSLTLRASVSPARVGQAYTEYIGEPLWRAGSDLVSRAIGKVGLGPALITRYGQPQAFVEAAKLRKVRIGEGAETGRSLGERLSKGLSKKEQLSLGRYVKGNLFEAELRTGRTDARWYDAIEAAKEARAKLDTLGGEAVTQNLLKDETFFRNYGKYMPRFYRKHELNYEGLLKDFRERTPTREDLAR